MMDYNGWIKPSRVRGFRTWLFHIWNDYELWRRGIPIDGIRICGFEWR